MNAAIAWRMTRADLLKLRKKPSTVVWSLVLMLLPLFLYFLIAALQHSSNPMEHRPAGGEAGFQDALRIVGAIFGPLAAVLIGTEAGAGDVASGVFRDLVVTGRSRVALFATRVPAALILTSAVAAIGCGVLAIGIYALASGSPDPSGATMLNGLGFTLLSAGIVCVVSVGFAALTGSRPAAITVLIAWHLVVSPLLGHITSLGSSRKLILNEAVNHFSPVQLGDQGHTVTLSQGFALLVLAGWAIVFVALGAWRTRTMDA
jgi:ABC-type transport system involved in multi-copper enzyme maturation permease subunit